MLHCGHMFKALSFLKPPAKAPLIQDPAYIQQAYKQWRIRIFYSIVIGYAFYYFTRSNLTAIMPIMVNELGYDITDLGILFTLFNLTYGISKFSSGILADKSNARYFMAIGLILSGICNLIFGMNSLVFTFALLWAVNGWVQGFGAPTCARLLTQWYSHNERGSWWSTWNISHNIGGGGARWLAILIAGYFGWRYSLYIPGITCIAVGFFLINRLRDTPESLGLPPIEEWRNDDSGGKSAVSSDKSLSTKEILFSHVLNNPFIWFLALSYFFVYFVRMGVAQWGNLYLTEMKSYDYVTANLCVMCFEFGGFFGAIAAGWISDYLFRSERGVVNVLFAAAMIVSFGSFFLLPGGYTYLEFGLLFFIGFAVYGPQMMIGLMAAEISPKNAAATANGFVGWIGYLGSAVAGYPLAYIQKAYGWDWWNMTLLFCCFISLLLLLPLWSVGKEKAKEKTAAA